MRDRFLSRHDESMLGVSDFVKGHIADGLQTSANILRTSADVYEVLDKLHADTHRAGKLIWNNKGMLKNMPTALINTLGHVSGTRSIDHSINPDTPNIMMLPGILSGVRSYSAFLNELKAYEIDNIPAPHLPSYLEAVFNIESATETAQKSLAFIYNSDIEGLVDLVAHSRGTIVALIMKILDEQNPGINRIGKVINIAGPHQGTEHVTIFYLNEVLAILGDMSPGSSSLEKLEDVAHKITVIVAANDSLISPAQQKIPGAHKEIILDIGHLDIPHGSKKDTKMLGGVVANELYAA